MTRYSKQDAAMTKGFAILCMVVLHLFCRQGADVLGTPLIWIDETTPLVFWFGFFAEICVPLYSICAGYAQQLLGEKGMGSWKANFKRIKKLLINYWIVLVLFSIIGLLFDPNGAIPGSASKFLMSIVLLYSYNGAWWYLNTYIILLLIPPAVLLAPIRKLSCRTGLSVCLLIQIAWYFVGRLNLWPIIPEEFPVTAFFWKEITNLITIIPYVWAGAFLCKGKMIDRLADIYKDKVSGKYKNLILLALWFALFVGVNLLHKAICFGVVSVISFFIFNLLEKSDGVKKVFNFLGKHSTNIWLTHMFFYLYIFKDLVTVVKYPLLMLLFIFGLCIIVSYVIMVIERIFYGLIRRLRGEDKHAGTIG